MLRTTRTLAPANVDLLMDRILSGVSKLCVRSGVTGAQQGRTVIVAVQRLLAPA